MGPISAPPPQVVDSLAALLTVIANPEAAAKLVADLQASSKELRDAAQAHADENTKLTVLRDAAASEAAGLERVRGAAEAARVDSIAARNLAVDKQAELEAVAAKLAADRQEFDAYVTQQNAYIAAALAEANNDGAAAEAARAEAVALRDELSAKIDALKKAVA